MHRHIRTHKQHERESYESDGSTDSSGSCGSTGSNTINNNNDYTKSQTYGEKRKSTDDDITNSRRKLRTVNNNNNNNIINIKNQSFCCPVCVRSDFTSMLSLENHMDQEHPGIPAKCRHCEIVFKSHKALNAHRCGNVNKTQLTQGLKDLTFIDFTSDKFPIIARSICEPNMRASATNQKYECSKCFKAFPCTSALQTHAIDCTDGDRPQNFALKRSRRNSETSDDDTRRDDFFANLHLQNKSHGSISTAGTSELLSTPSTDKSFSSPFSLSTSSAVKDPRLLSPYSQSDTKDLADIQSIINNTSSSGGFWKQLDRSLPEKDQDSRSCAGDEEEAQDAFTAEFRKMKLRGEFPCRLCTSVFPNLRALKGHNRIHLSAAGPGPYRCNMCPYVINDKATLIRHMRTHNGDRPYECAICNYAFTTKANCERHLRNRHGKNTREEIKRSIIYHPSEDSSCDDPIKKMAMFTSPDIKRDEVPKDRSTPVSHLRASLTFESTPKIQVTSLEKLIERKPEISIKPIVEEAVTPPKPIDLSMDVLDLSKKSSSKSSEKKTEEDDEVESKPEFDLNLFEKNQQLLLLQQQLLSEALPKINPAHYFQFLYRNLGFPPTFPLHPLFLQSSLLGAQNAEEMKNLLPPPQMAGGTLLMNPFANVVNQSTSSAETSPTKNTTQPATPNPPPMPDRSMSPKFHDSQRSTTPQQISTPIKPAPPLSPGPVKMVIKNGVLMPKQKQRRYRTERPFACEHCSARFTLRSNMERHIKQQHPQFWASRQKGGHHLMRRGSAGLSPLNTLMPQSVAPNFSTSSFGGISDQVKYAILAQQLKSSRDPPGMILQNALANGSASLNTSGGQIINNNNDDDEPKLVIDEEDSQPEPPIKMTQKLDPENANEIARKIAQDILEQAKKLNSANSMIISKIQDKDLEVKPKVEKLSRREIEQDQASQSKEEDLVSVSKLVDNATMSFGSYFK